jgi:hypothetical protein
MMGMTSRLLVLRREALVISSGTKTFDGGGNRLSSISIGLNDVDGDQAAQRLDEYSELYAEVYAEPPYEWGAEHAELFRRRMEVQCRQEGFALVDATTSGRLVGMGFGVTLSGMTPWWQNLLGPLPRDVTEERPGRTWALVELLVRKPLRRLHVAEAIHDRLLAGRSEERATLTVLPAATAAQAAALTWGWQKVAQKRNPLPAAPVFDVMVKDLR